MSCHVAGPSDLPVEGAIWCLHMGKLVTNVAERYDLE